MIEEIIRVSKEEKYYEEVHPIVTQLKTKLEQEKEKDLLKFKEEISHYLANEIVARYYFQKGRIINQLSYDPDIKMAKQILTDTVRYKSILTGKK